MLLIVALAHSARPTYLPVVIVQAYGLAMCVRCIGGHNVF